MRAIYEHREGVIRVTMLYLSFSGPCLKTQGLIPHLHDHHADPVVYGFIILKTLDDG